MVKTGNFIFLNLAPVACDSAQQATVKLSVFGAEFVALKQGIEALRGSQHKLHIVDVLMSRPSHVCGDDMSMIDSSLKSDSTLNKKLNQVCCHFLCESVAMGECDKLNLCFTAIASG